MRYIPTTKQEQQHMLDTIGVSGIDDLFADIPEELRLDKPLNLPPALAEGELRRHMQELAARNVDLDRYPSFLGAGAYDRLVPAAVAHIVQRGEFLTAYTPYQPEISQGVLQATYEYQSMIAHLTGLPVANASMYDGATALAEACLVACAQTRRDRIVLPMTVHPEYRHVTETYVRHQDVEIAWIPRKGGRVDLDALREAVDDETAAVVVQQPNFFGSLEDVDAIGEIARAAGALYIAVVDPVSIALLRPPGEYGADIALGEGQPLGNAISFGGPYVGFFATSERLMRRIPGRIVGQTEDTQGRRGFVLTLQTREQHIRRERATSNICTNQALNALTAAVYMALQGPQGLREVAEQSLRKSHYLRNRLLTLPGVEAPWDAPFFQEFVVRLPGDPEEIGRRLLDAGIIGGLPLGPYDEDLKNAMLFCVTEARTKEEMDRLVDVLQDLLGGESS